MRICADLLSKFEPKRDKLILNISIDLSPFVSICVNLRFSLNSIDPGGLVEDQFV